MRAMLVHPGASRFIFDVRIPYSEAALAACLGGAPESSCSEGTARRMAAKALEGGTLGIACTAALRTTRDRKGEDRAHLCFKTTDREEHRCIDLPVLSREEQDEYLSRELIARLADFLGVAP